MHLSPQTAYAERQTTTNTLLLLKRQIILTCLSHMWQAEFERQQ